MAVVGRACAGAQVRPKASALGNLGLKKFPSIIFISTFMLTACSGPDPEVVRCENYFSVMTERLSELERELTQDEVCFGCVESIVKNPSGVEDLSQDIERCSAKGAYGRRVDFLVSSVSKRVDNIVYEVEQMKEPKTTFLFYGVIEDRVDGLKPMLSEMASQVEK